MNTEGLEQLRQRLLGDEHVRSMIEIRAYEIFQQRGGEQGHEVENWFQAEGEILAFMIEEESTRHVEAAAAERVKPAVVKSTVEVKTPTAKRKALGGEGEEESKPKKKKKAGPEKSKKAGRSKAKRKKDRAE